MSDNEFEVRDRRPRGWFWIDNSLMDQWAAIIGVKALLVYICLCRHADNDQKAWPSQSLLGKKLGMSESSVRRGIRALEKHAIIRSEKVKEKGRFARSVYHLLDQASWMGATELSTSESIDEKEGTYPQSYPQDKPPVTQTAGQNSQNEGISAIKPADHHRSHRPPNKTNVKQQKQQHPPFIPPSPEEGDSLSIKPKSRKKHKPEDFNFLKDYQQRTWKLSGGEYPWGKVDAGMLARILSYGLPTAMALLDLFWDKIRCPENKWVMDNVGRNAKGLLQMLPRLMDMAEVKTRAKKHESALLAAIPGADLKAAETLADTIASGFKKLPAPPNQEEMRRSALAKADAIAKEKEWRG